MSSEVTIGRSEVRQLLLVDDTASMLALYGRALTALGYAVTLAEDGRRALEELERMTPDLIVLDCMMPGMSGLEVLAEVRSTPHLRDVPVIFLTASGDDDDIVNRAFELGVSDYICKPVNHRVLSARINALIAQRRELYVERESQKISIVNNLLLDQMSKAQSVQRGQLPTVPVRWRNWEANACLLPCDEVGGDLFDVILGPDDTWTIALLDVSGHGLAAAMVASAVRAAIRLLVRTVPFPAVMPELNRQLCDGTDHHYACVGLVQIQAGKISAINAGLPPMTLIQNGEIMGTVVGSGPPPGLLTDIDYTYETIEERSGLRLVMVSDGLTEPFGLPNAVGFCLDGLNLRSPHSGRVTLGLADQVRRLFSAHGTIQPDDATLVILDCLGHVKT